MLLVGSRPTAEASPLRLRLGRTLVPERTLEPSVTRQTANQTVANQTAPQLSEIDRLMRKIRIKETAVGKGVFAQRAIAADVVVGEILGEILDDHPEDSNYCMELQSGRLLEPAPPLRFLNHSCEPNCELFYWVDEESDEPVEDRLWLQTLRQISADEEMTIDYSWPADAAIRCRCDAPSCRGWIVDPDEFDQLAESQPEAWNAYVSEQWAEKAAENQSRAAGKTAR